MTDDNGTRARLDALTRMLDERENRSLERHHNIKEILDRYIVYTDKRFHDSNEWRQALRDQNAGGMTRREYEVQHTSLATKVEDVSSRVSLIMGIGFGVNFAIMAALGVLTLIFHH
jgi:hypothetical protein